LQGVPWFLQLACSRCRGWVACWCIGPMGWGREGGALLCQRPNSPARPAFLVRPRPSRPHQSPPPLHSRKLGVEDDSEQLVGATGWAHDMRTGEVHHAGELCHDQGALARAPAHHDLPCWRPRRLGQLAAPSRPTRTSTPPPLVHLEELQHDAQRDPPQVLLAAVFAQQDERSKYLGACTVEGVGAGGGG
jgi:hypothetical protein